MHAFAQKQNQAQRQSSANAARAARRMPMPAKAPIKVQTKLTISTPGDSYEQEADHIAEEVMRMAEPQVQRACPCGGGCPRCQTGPPRQEQRRLQTKHVGANDSEQ